MKMPKKFSNAKLIIANCTNCNKQLRAPFLIYVDFKSYLEKVKKIKKMILINLTLINMKIIMVIVKDINQLMLMIDLVSLYKYLEVKMLFENL